MVTRGFETRLQILSSKVLWYVALVQSRPRFYMAPASADILKQELLALLGALAVGAQLLPPHLMDKRIGSDM